MSLPRQILPGSTYMVTRRCARRQLLLRPSPLVNQIILYCLARAADEHGILVHAAVAMSNHVHLVVTDPDGSLPRFTHWFFEYTAKCVNVLLGRWENLWSSEEPSYVRLETTDDVLDKILYVMSNPTAAALVPNARQWPGVVTLPEDLVSEPIEVERPKVFFRPNGPTPAKVSLQFVPPPGLEDPSPESYVEMLTRELKLREVDLRLQHAREERPILGKRAVLTQDPFSYPAGMEPRGELNPRIAAKSKWTRIEAIRRLKSFVQDYARALAAYLAGDHEVLFPAGTYWMVRHAGAACVAPG